MEKLLPHNIEAEQGVLGSLIIDPDAIVRIQDFLAEDDFIRPAHRAVYAIIRSCFERGDLADFITICDALERQGRLAEIGASYITSLINDVPTSGNVEYYARIVERTAILRRLIGGASQIAALAYEDETSAEDALRSAQEIIYTIAERRKIDRLTSHREGLPAYFNDLAYLNDCREAGKAITGVATGFPRLDTMTGGLQRGDLITIAARPSIGKSALALNIALNAIRSGYEVLFFSLEMDKRQLWQRLLADGTGIDQARLRIGDIHHDGTIQQGERSYQGEWDLIADRINALTETPGTLWVDDSTSLTPLDMRTRSLRVQAYKGLDLVIVDYLQLAKATARIGRGNGYENRVQEISSITKDLKNIARDLSLPVLALAQLSRAAEGIEPHLSHLKESGSIEEDSDVVALMWLSDEAQAIRSAERKEGQPPAIYPVEWKIAKQRKGPVGKMPLRFIPWLTRFEEI